MVKRRSMSPDGNLAKSMPDWEKLGRSWASLGNRILFDQHDISVDPIGSAECSLLSHAAGFLPSGQLPSAVMDSAIEAKKLIRSDRSQINRRECAKRCFVVADWAFGVGKDTTSAPVGNDDGNRKLADVAIIENTSRRWASLATLFAFGSWIDRADVHNHAENFRLLCRAAYRCPNGQLPSHVYEAALNAQELLDQRSESLTSEIAKQCSVVARGLSDIGSPTPALPVEDSQPPNANPVACVNTVNAVEGNAGADAVKPRKTVKGKRSGHLKNSEELFKSALKSHHGYEIGGSVSTYDYASTRRISELVENRISAKTAERQFNEHFGNACGKGKKKTGGVEAYRQCCVAKTIGKKLVFLFGDILKSFGSLGDSQDGISVEGDSNSDDSNDRRGRDRPRVARKF